MEQESETTTNWAEKRIFTTGEAAELCKVSQQTIIRCFDNGRLGGFRVPGSKFRRIPRAELIKFMKANDIPTGILDQGKKRVLVVDDDTAIIEMFQEILGKDSRIDLRVAQTGYDAGMLTEAFRPNLLILDYLLPDVNGDLVLRRLRERDEHAGTKVLIISGVVNQAEIQQLLDGGALGFMRKPFDVNELLKKVSELLEV